ncbi:hypothetical protein B0H17DRAFT_1194547 [Mycena rosella]|uniref:Uncharacterized protein n=1 Tax=Mycena rosella TaxID=1033263 RepID=A0AAD7E1I1_MYCRO|nr:hypothetical protein B0H17DRAFT_1194547 [Mycena rosella]
MSQPLVVSQDQGPSLDTKKHVGRNLSKGNAVSGTPAVKVAEVVPVAHLCQLSTVAVRTSVLVHVTDHIRTAFGTHPYSGACSHFSARARLHQALARFAYTRSAGPRWPCVPKLLASHILALMPIVTAPVRHASLRILHRVLPPDFYLVFLSSHLAPGSEACQVSGTCPHDDLRDLLIAEFHVTGPARDPRVAMSPLPHLWRFSKEILFVLNFRDIHMLVHSDNKGAIGALTKGCSLNGDINLCTR